MLKTNTVSDRLLAGDAMVTDPLTLASEAIARGDVLFEVTMLSIGLTTVEAEADTESPVVVFPIDGVILAATSDAIVKGVGAAALTVDDVFC